MKFSNFIYFFCHFIAEIQEYSGEQFLFLLAGSQNGGGQSWAVANSLRPPSVSEHADLKQVKTTGASQTTAQMNEMDYNGGSLRSAWTFKWTWALFWRNSN